MLNHQIRARLWRQTAPPPAAVAASALLVLGTACQQRIEPPMALDSVVWTEYRNDELGVTLEVPSTWQAEARGNSVRFEGDVTTAMRLTLATPQEAERRGLWGRTPVVRVDTSADLGWRFYRYRHYDGPSYTPTLAFVVSHRGQELGIEFRTRAAEPDSVERHILESVRLR